MKNITKYIILGIAFAVLISATSAQTFSSVWGTSRPMTCSDSYNTLISNSVLNLTLSNTRYFFGYEVVAGNQNPCVARFDSQNQIWCRCDYETSEAFGTAYGGMWDGDINSLFVVFSTDGSANDNYNRYTTEGWIKRYGDINFAEVAIILEIDEQNGVPSGVGTFIKAENSFGGTQYARLKYFEKTKVSTMRITFDAGEFPLNFDLTHQTCDDINLQPNDYYTWIIEIPLNLKMPLSTAADNCSGKLPPASATSTPRLSSHSATRSRSPGSSASRSRNPRNNSSNTSNTSNSSGNNNSSSASSLFFSMFLFAIISFVSIF